MRRGGGGKGGSAGWPSSVSSAGAGGGYAAESNAKSGGGGGGGAWASYNQAGSYNKHDVGGNGTAAAPAAAAENSNKASSTTTTTTSLPTVLRAVEDATGPTEWALHSACQALEHPSIARGETETVLNRLVLWLTAPTSQVLSMAANSNLPRATAGAIRKYRNEPPVASLACNA